jgi:hypothetical protein
MIYTYGGRVWSGAFQADDVNTYKCSFSKDSTLLVPTFQMYTEPSAEPTEMYWPSGLNAARDQSQPTLKPSALKRRRRRKKCRVRHVTE